MIRVAPFFLVSFLFHGVLLFGSLSWFPWITSPGHPGVHEERLFVEVVAETPMMASAPTPSATDSAASTPSKPSKELTKQEQTREEPPQTTEEAEPETPQNKDATPLPVLARASEEPDPDFVRSEEPPTESPEPIAQHAHHEKEEETKDPTEDPVPKEREKELSADTQQQSAPSPASTPRVASRRTVVTRSCRGHDLVDYKAKVIAAIKKASFYPRKAAKKKQRGTAVVRFRIWRGGKVDSIEISCSSGSKILDEAALQIVQKAEKNFPKVPDFFQGQHLVYAVPIVFKKRATRRN